MEEFRSLGKKRITLYFFPEPGEKVKCICIVSDGELACIASGSSKEADFVVSILLNTVSKTRKRCISKDLQFFKGHTI